MGKNALDWVALILVIVGGLNWGLIGIANFNFVELILGAGVLAKVVYGVVGIAALYLIYFAVKG